MRAEKIEEHFKTFPERTYTEKDKNNRIIFWMYDDRDYDEIKYDPSYINDYRKIYIHFNWISVDRIKFMNIIHMPSKML